MSQSWIIINGFVAKCDITCISPVGELHVSDPWRESQLHFPPGMEVSAASNRAGIVVHCVSVNSFAGYISNVCAALAGRPAQGKIHLCYDAKHNTHQKLYRFIAQNPTILRSDLETTSKVQKRYL